MYMHTYLAIFCNIPQIYRESYTDVMVIIWKRLSDHGKNWRRVYKVRMLTNVMWVVSIIFVVVATGAGLSSKEWQ